ncbi:uncharacterized protein LODBEIA_P54420 [Lodderomyces beijingensis]|uniref:Bromo domain-containing protein n=1 Tax=Lodderomyces beijingensis TaxID=1775926 RepID=A0ABP0ZSV7_9ASCO
MRRKILSDDDSDAGDAHESRPRRATRGVSYAEEKNDENDDDDEDPTDKPQSGKREKPPRAEDALEDDEETAAEPSSPEKDDGGDDYDADDFNDDSDDKVSRPKRNRKPRASQRKPARGRKRHLDSDDEDFQDDGDDGGDEDEDDLSMSDEDEYVEKKKRDAFIVKDENDWDEDEDGAYGDRRKSKKRKGRSKKSRSASIEPRRATRSGRFLEEEHEESTMINNTVDGDEEDDIRQEVADLYDSSPMHDSEPAAHKLRQRTKVDYTIPPPITNDMFAERPSTPTGLRGRKGRPTKQNEFRQILYPTAGPFGGSDVISLFGTNIPPGGIPLTGGSTTGNNMTAIGQNVSDSDTSEDEIAPINGEATVSKKQNPKRDKSGGKLITGGTDDNKNTSKGKNNLSDTDPLGVDMNIDFSVVGGLDNYINQLKEMVALPLLYPELYQNFAITPPRGVLFHGPPGTGKTLMARALAASCSTSERKITFFMRKGADCLSKWVGEAERQLRLLFEEAKNQQPSIIFFDEIDGLAPVRSSKQEQIHASIVSTLLALMDGMDNRGQVIVIGATNRPDAIDPALRRPGRFDREFYFPLPDIDSRKEILKIHTKKWVPPLRDDFLGNLADLTKGYGGADLRALCTEAALNSIQRKYPQIYETNHKLVVHPSKVKVIAKDFMKALERIVPSSARSTTGGSSPLPEHLKPLLQAELDEILLKLNDLLPASVNTSGKLQKFTALDEAKYLDPTTKDADGGFAKQQLLRTLENSRICRPHLLISGREGNGQQYLAAAVLNHLEGFQVQSLDLGSMFGDSTRTPESAIVQAFIEARRHQPAIILIPSIDIWFDVLPSPAKATLSSLLRGLKSNEKLLLLGIAESSMEDLGEEIRGIFGFESPSNNIALRNPNESERRLYFATLWQTLSMKPFEFVNDLQNRPKRKLKQLKIADVEIKASESELTRKKIREQEYQDTKLKNVLKIKLASLMDLFKVRYKRFKKPIVDENLLYHLFDPSVLDNPLNNYQVLYIRSEDPGSENMIKEITTGRNYYNMDLDTIEERLWNGFYSEPKQFLKDLKLILKDSVTSNDRDRILKANEMITNAQFGIDDISTPEFVKACKEVRERDLIKQKQLLKEHEELKAKMEANAAAATAATADEVVLNGTVADSGHPVNNADAPGPGPAPTPGETKTKAGDLNGATPEIDSNGGVGVAITETIEVDNNANGSSKETTTAVIEDAESESEAEELLDVDFSRQVQLDQSKVTLLQARILEMTAEYNVERLEIVMARLMDVIWKDRNEWDKSQTLADLEATISSLQATL